MQIRDAANPTCVIVLGDQIITQPATLSCSIVQNKAVSANGLSDGQATVTPLGGNGGYTYLWDNTETTVKALGLSAGLHSVTVTDSKGCKTTCDVTISQPGVLSCSISQDAPAKCFSDSNGKATVTAIGGNGEYTYLWDNSETTAQAVALNAGNHTVTVTDKLGYKTSCEVSIGQPQAALSITATNLNNNNCVSCNNGLINITVSGGTAPYTFSWSNGATTEDILNLQKGTYSVEVKDAKGCTVNYTYYITESGIALVKSGTFNDTNTDGYAKVGESISYAFTVKNTGNVTLTNIVVNDPLVSVTGGPITSLAVGATDTTTFTATYILTQADIDAGKVTNSALATAKDPNQKDVTDISGTTLDNDTNTVVNLPQNASIAIVKTNNITIEENGCATLKVGDLVTYTFTATNPGNVSLHDVAVLDPHIGLSAITLQSGSDVNANSILEVTETWVYNATYTVTQADIDAGKITNQATVNGTTPNNSVVTDQSGNSTTNDSPNVIPICTTPKIALVKTGLFNDTNNDSYAQVGETITYTFTVTNTGNVTLTNIDITDPLIGLTISGNPIASLASGATDNSVTGVYTITQADIDAGKVTNSALATAKDPKGNDVTDISGTTVENDTPTVTPLPQTPSIVLVKTSAFSDTNNDGFPQVGEKINYTFTVTNIGNVVVNNVVISDPLVGLTITGNPIVSLIPGATNSSVTGVYTITQADIDAGNVTNSALATGKDYNNIDVTDISGTTIDNDTPTLTPLTQKPGLEVIKIANSDNYSSVGDIINYTIQVKNTGNVTLHQIIVTDELTNFSTTIESLAPGSSKEITQNYTVVQDDRINGSVTNTAKADGLTPNDTPIHAEDDAVVEASIVLGCGNIIVHNAFSPNGDGINETFVIENLEDILCYPTNTIEIYNRWGVLVFETRNYDNLSNYFDGISRGRTTIKQSSGLPTGTYYYILKYTSIDGLGGVLNNIKDGYLYLTR